MKVPTAEPLRETAIRAASTPTLAPESMPTVATQSYQAPPVLKQRSMIPIYAGAAAMVLFAMVLVPVFLMTTNRMASGPPNTGSPPLQYPTATNSNTSANANSTGNVNSDFEVAPDVKFGRLDGGTMRLSDFRGRVLLLNFWGSWNPVSRREVPVLNELHKDFKDRGLTVIGISADDTAEKVREFQKETAQDYLIGLSDKEVQDQLKAGRVPTTYIIDRRGRIRKKLIGMQSRETFEAAIEPLINERL
jgi:peroxiredoxin